MSNRIASDRYGQMTDWLDSLGYRDYTLSVASADASFRSYHRLETASQTWIVMDAPPDREPCQQFIAIAGRLRAAGLSAPEVIHQDQMQGFLLLTDFGALDYLKVLDTSSVDSLYSDALAALLKMQSSMQRAEIPDYDENLLYQEMGLFRHWFLEQLLEINLDQVQQQHWQETQPTLVDNALRQPQVFVHRDYHSRNLMNIEQNNPGILDFQDAVWGPITYDLVSLLRDCYIAWPEDMVERLALEYYESSRASKLQDVAPELFLQWFNLMGIQRHLKAIGIFSRLKIRDGKAGYLKDIPRTLNYLERVSAKENSMAGLHRMIVDLDLRSRVEAFQ